MKRLFIKNKADWKKLMQWFLTAIMAFGLISAPLLILVQLLAS